jgi:predicted dehydrogenase
MADLATFIRVRQQPKGQVETFSQERTADTVSRVMSTEDAALVLLRYPNGARGQFAVSQVSAGRKNSLQYEVGGSAGSAAWDSETPDHLWLGHRERPNEILLRNPALMGTDGIRASFLPGGHVEGFADTFRAMYASVYAAIGAGKHPIDPPWATFGDGHYEMLVGDAIATSAREGRWVDIVTR